MDAFSQKAVELVTSPKARDAFDLGREPAAVRARYGMHRYGQRCLLARRLVEAGCPFVTMVLENPSPPGESFPKDVTYTRPLKRNRRTNRAVPGPPAPRYRSTSSRSRPGQRRERNSSLAATGIASV